ncbi:MAG TPA: lysoplasmalogenase family protein [Intrasporangium sp.]|uniref:lysoplasmalogenase family protein n=1 Tax=Intrasporangium sp. TaxID=1925024 RepID=UPI002B45EE65|nr:lysoplasmalogenase family protein [Intrasporangium sp.]HKX68609.1 lysoplasmalogenase family protein [Intrasporangium sp.]
MDTHVMVLAVALAFTAVLNWFAVARGDHVVDLVTRPTFPFLLIGLAWSLAAVPGAADGSAAWVLPQVITALGLSLLTDLLLLTATETRYLLGLWTSLLANVAWTWAVVSVPGHGGLPWWVLVAVPFVVVAHGRWGRDVIRYAGRQRGSVFLHLLSLVGLVLVAAWQGDVVVLGGGALLLVSHLVLAHDRFCLERRWAPVLAMVAYHAALVLLVIGLVGRGTFGR